MCGATDPRVQRILPLVHEPDEGPLHLQMLLKRLAAALTDLDAKVYTESVPEGLPFDCSAATLARAPMWKLVTNAGRLDIAFEPAGVKGYSDLTEHAERFEAFGVRFLVASLDDIIRSKEAAGRPKDLDDVAILQAMKRRR